MAKAIWICSRKKLSNAVGQKIYEICKIISPDNIVPADPKVIISNNIAYGVMNPKNSLLYNGNSLLLGAIAGNLDNWHVPLQNFPDGSYALFRDGEQYCELVSDPAASRTIWYYKNDEIFVASTSQIALIKFIGGFEFDERVVPWMLSTGSMGPTHSWDKRINRIPPDSSVILSKHDWSLDTKDNNIEFKECKDSNKHSEQKLRTVLHSSIESMKLNYSDWVLPVSGGYDTRGILCLLKSNNNNKDLKTITWGLKSSLNDSKNDAFVAQKLAKELNVPHKYYHTDL
jgi:asparagine synthetase B (glutamine-hydrolysing)